MTGHKSCFLSRIFKTERLLWHKHFIPSLIAAVAMLLVALFTALTFADMILFASFGATAAILTHMKYHHLTKLHTIIIAYLIAVVSGIIIFLINQYLIDLSLPMDIFLVVLITGCGMIMFNSFHPPSVGAGISFFLSSVKIEQTIHVFIGAIILFVVIRFLTYIFSSHLPLKDFYTEFKREL